MSSLLPQIVGLLACPLCGEGFDDIGSSVRCANGHAFDIARQGYLNLLGGKPAPHLGDTAEMVAERDAVLSSGLFEPIASAVARRLSQAMGETEGLVVDIGAGTGYYLARALDELPQAFGLALDVSKYAARRAARSHPRTSAVVCDVWSRIPLRSESAAGMLNVFSPRNPAEMGRVARQGAPLVVVTPTPDHLRELVDTMGLLQVPENKLSSVAEALAPWFSMEDVEPVTEKLAVAPEQAVAIAEMGPSAFHSKRPGAGRSLHYHPDGTWVTLSVDVSVFRSRHKR